MRTLLLFLVVGGLLIVGVLPHTPALGATDPIDVAQAQSDLTRFKSLLKTWRSSNEDLLAALGSVRAALAAPEGGESLGASYRKAALSAFLKALRLRHVSKDLNVREPVNVEAADALALVMEGRSKGERHALSDKVRTLIDAWRKVRKPRVTRRQYEAAFDLVGHLNDPDSLAWIAKRYKSSENRTIDELVAAFGAVPLFRDAPGALRYAACKSLIPFFAGVEANAERSASDTGTMAKKRFWDEAKGAVLAAIQHLADQPRDDEDRVLARLEALNEWWRAHKSASKSPWVSD